MSLTLGGDGQITSSNVLNINANGIDNPTPTSVTFQVGATGDFETINQALEALSRSIPVYVNTGVMVTLNLLSGFVMQEQVLVKGLNFGWVKITGTDAETSIAHTALTTDFTTDDYDFESRPSFGVSKGGVLPIIDQLFRMTPGGLTTEYKHGIISVGAGSSAGVTSGAGFADCAASALYANRGATITAQGAIATGAGFNGLYASNGSIINAPNVDCSSAGNCGIQSSNGSTINATSTIATDAGVYGVYATDSASVNFTGGDASGSGTNGIYAYGNSNINADGADCSGCTTRGVLASGGSVISAYNVNCSGAGLTGLYATQASLINADLVDATNCTQYAIYANRASTINAQGSDTTGAGVYGFYVTISSVIGATNTVGTPTYSQTINAWSNNGWIGV